MTIDSRRIESLQNVLTHTVIPVHMKNNGWQSLSLSPHTPTVFLIQQSWVNNCVSLLSSLCARATSEENGVGKLWKSDGVLHCSVQNAAVLCKSHSERVPQFLTSPSEEEKKRRKTFWDFLVQYFRDTFPHHWCVFGHENTQRWTVHCHKGL